MRCVGFVDLIDRSHFSVRSEARIGNYLRLSPRFSSTVPNAGPRWHIEASELRYVSGATTLRLTCHALRRAKTAGLHLNCRSILGHRLLRCLPEETRMNRRRRRREFPRFSYCWRRRNWMVAYHPNPNVRPDWRLGNSGELDSGVRQYKWRDCLWEGFPQLWRLGRKFPFNR
jgi:hypothetical protein